MLSSILNSKEAISINITIMRIFTRLRSFIAMESENKKRLDKHISETHKVFKIVFERLDDIDAKETPMLPEKRKKIGL